MTGYKKTAQEWYNLGNQAYKKGDLDGAIRDFTESIRLEPNNTYVYEARGMSRCLKRDMDGAIKDFNESIRLNPNNTNAYYYRGIARNANGDLDGAIMDYSESIRIKADNADAYEKRGMSRYAKGDLDGAIRDCTEVIRLKPDYADAYFARGGFCYEKRDLDGAIRDCTESIKLKSNNADPYNIRGLAHYDKGDLDDAIRDYTYSLQLKPHDANTYHGLGLAWQAIGDWDSAIRNYTESIRINPHNAEAYYGRGVARYIIGDPDSAVRDFTEYIRLKPNNSDAYNKRGMAREAKHELDEAISDYTVSIRLNTNNAEAYYGRGLAREAKHDLDGAIKDFTESIRLKPSADAYNDRGAVRSDKGDFDGAIADFTESIRLKPDNAHAYHNRGLARRVKGDWDGGTKDLTEANKYDTTYRPPSEAHVAYAPPVQVAKQALPEQKSTDVDTADIEELFKELNSLTGLERVKKEVRQLIQFVKIQNMRKLNGLGATELSLHTVYFGSPGTGKTTVARIYGKMLKALGLLNKGHLVETDRASLVANYVGQTANKTDEKINEAMGGVLFIDEAYSLYKSEQAAGWDYGSEAIEVLMKRMEDNRNNFAVIVAGYPGPMEAFLNSNEGFKSRFVNYIHFEDYSAAELTQIFVSFCGENNYSLSDDALEIAKKVIANEFAKKEKTFGNARYCRNLFEQIIRYQAQRIGETGTQPTVSQLKTIEAQDISPLLVS